MMLCFGTVAAYSELLGPPTLLHEDCRQQEGRNSLVSIATVEVRIPIYSLTQDLLSTIGNGVRRLIMAIR